MCFHAPIYEAHHAEGTLIGGLKEHLPRLTSLETLELHICSKAYFSGEEIIFAIPNSLKRLYVSDKLISAKKLEKLIAKRYLWSNSKAPEPTPEGYTLETLQIDDAFDYPVSFLVSPQFGTQVGSQNTGFVPQNVRDYRSKPKGYHTKRKGKQVYIRCDNEIIGETSKRTDHIPFRHGKLGFIGYEYEGHQDCCECEWCDEAKLILLRLNGRLLDRERNSHLAVLHDHSQQVWPRTAVDAETDTEVEDAVDMKMTMEELEMLEQITEKWDSNPKNKFFGYFGTENEAAEHFKTEVAVKAEELTERKWAEEAMVGVKEHWLSEA